MFAVYPLHLQKEIDRRWLLRSEETVWACAPQWIESFFERGGRYP